MSLLGRIALRSVAQLTRSAAVLALIGLAIMAYSIVSPRPLPVVLAMSAGHAIGAIAVVLYVLAIVLDAARTVVYRGAVDDQYGLGYALDAPRSAYLRAALADLLAGKTPAVSATTAPGCELDAAPAAMTARTYHARVERIIQANCVTCHR